MDQRGRMPTARLWACLAALSSAAAGAADWPALDPAQLALTAEPQAPDAPAVYLLRQVERDDALGEETDTLVIKVLSDSGRRYGDVQIPFFENEEAITGIDARTIQPDGRITPFDGKVYELPLLKARGVKMMSKRFALPDVQVGSVLEYRYRRVLDLRTVFDSVWILNADLYTEHAAFTLHANPNFALSWRWPLGAPAGAGPMRRAGSHLSLDVRDVPAFVAEEAMPPEDALMQRVEFEYGAQGAERDVNRYWQLIARERFRLVDQFVDHRRAMTRALAQIIDAGDAPAIRLQKIYDRVQRLRNTSFAAGPAQVQWEPDRPRSPDDAADVWERGYGADRQITWLFLALARAAGLQADPVEIARRDRDFFDMELCNGRSLNASVVRIRLEGREIYAVPGVPRTPLGMLPWYETGVVGLVISADGGTWTRTPLPTAEDSRVERRATLSLGRDGSLEGHLTIILHGLAALGARLAVLDGDAAARAESLERSVRAFLPAAAEATLTNLPDWDASTATLRAEFDVRVPAFAEQADDRVLLRVSPFIVEEGRAFTSRTRLHPLYFAFPWMREDRIAITLPMGEAPLAVPDPVSADAGPAKYRCAVDFHDAVLTVRRVVELDGFLFTPDSYEPLRKFGDAVRTSDERQIVLPATRDPAPR